MKVSVITGAGRGIGRAISLKFAEHSFNVALVSRTKRELDKVSTECKKYNVETTQILCDVGDEMMVKDMIDHIVAEYRRIDVLINNAGSGTDCEVKNMSLERWEAITRTNLTGTFLCSRYVLPIMIKQNSGVIVNISSIFGKKGLYGGSAYSASKFGIIGFTESLSEEIKKYGIRVNVVCPGAVDTDFIKRTKPDIPKEKLIQPEEVAEVVYSLTCDSAKAITGQSINVGSF